MNTLVNLTHQPITFLNHQDEPATTVKPSGVVVEISMDRSIESHANANGHLVPVMLTTYGEPDPLPEPKENVLYIVSNLYRAKNPRHDLVSPGPLLRNADGKPIGTHSLIR